MNRGFCFAGFSVILQRTMECLDKACMLWIDDQLNDVYPLIGYYFNGPITHVTLSIHALEAVSRCMHEK